MHEDRIGRVNRRQRLPVGGQVERGTRSTSVAAQVVAHKGDTAPKFVGLGTEWQVV